MSINEVRYLPECGSTNAYVKEHFEEFGPVGAVYTENQTAGRGRLGRSWVNAEGRALYYTAVIREPLAQPATLPLLASLAVRTQLKLRYGVDCQIKWPNDLLLNGKKIVGILTEGVADLETQLIKHVIVGTGINYLTDPSEFPEEIRQRAGSLRRYTLDSGVSRNAFIANYLNEFFSLYQNYKAASFMDEYRAHSNTIGKDVTINRSGQTSEGHVATIDNQGRLVLSSGETLASGEVTKIRSTD